MAQPTEVARDIFVGFTAAFAGAFFAYVFTRVAEFFNFVFERQRRHINALARLANQLNDYNNQSISWKRQIRDFAGSVEAGKAPFSLPTAFSFDGTLQLDILDPDTRLRCYEVALHTGRANHDVANLREGYMMYLQSHLSGSVPIENFLQQARMAADRLNEMLPVIEKVDKKALELMARVRLRARVDAPLASRAMWAMTRPRTLRENELARSREAVEKTLRETRGSLKEELVRPEH